MANLPPEHTKAPKVTSLVLPVAGFLGERDSLLLRFECFLDADSLLFLVRII